MLCQKCNVMQAHCLFLDVLQWNEHSTFWRFWDQLSDLLCLLVAATKRERKRDTEAEGQSEQLKNIIALGRTVWQKDKQDCDVLELNQPQ